MKAEIKWSWERFYVQNTVMTTVAVFGFCCWTWIMKHPV